MHLFEYSVLNDRFLLFFQEHQQQQKLITLSQPILPTDYIRDLTSTTTSNTNIQQESYGL